MYTPYNEKVCKSCPFAGKVFTTKIGTAGIEYIDCKRDNTDAQENFIHTNNNESLLLWLRQAEFEHCFKAYDEDSN